MESIFGKTKSNYNIKQQSQKQNGKLQSTMPTLVSTTASVAQLQNSFNVNNNNNNAQKSIVQNTSNQNQVSVKSSQSQAVYQPQQIRQQTSANSNHHASHVQQIKPTNDLRQTSAKIGDSKTNINDSKQILTRTHDNHLQQPKQHHTNNELKPTTNKINENHHVPIHPIKQSNDSRQSSAKSIDTSQYHYYPPLLHHVQSHDSKHQQLLIKTNDVSQQHPKPIHQNNEASRHASAKVQPQNANNIPKQHHQNYKPPPKLNENNEPATINDKKVDNVNDKSKLLNLIIRNEPLPNANLNDELPLFDPDPARDEADTFNKVIVRV